MRVIVAGGRKFEANQERVWRCAEILKSIGATVVLSGRCGRQRGKDYPGYSDGADGIGERAAEILGIPVEPHPADWSYYKKQAGPLRNHEMVKTANALIVFPGSEGTADVIRKAEGKGIQIFRYTGDRVHPVNCKCKVSRGNR